MNRQQMNPAKRITKTNKMIIYMVAIVFPFSLQECHGFSLTRNPFTAVRQRVTTTRNSNYDNTKNFNTRKCRQMATVDNNDAASLLSDDPFVILGLAEPTADKKVLKRAYKRRALKFHPDAITDLHSSREDKKKASDMFAKVNWAYATVMGKNKDSPSSTGRSSSSSSSSSPSGWTPPHRRSGGYSNSASTSSSSDNTDWRDFIPNYGNNKDTNDKDYDTGGDSFGQIFSDLFTSAATGVSAGSGGGIFSDFIEFLEGNVGGGANNDGSKLDDADLRILLKTGSLEEVAEEMDDTELVVQQLESKATILDNELFGTDAEAKMTSKFSEKIELEERASELKARKVVVLGFLKRARTRLLSLQTRYKDLITYEGANDSYASSGGRRRSDRQSTSSSSQNDFGGSSPSYSSSSSGRTSSTSASTTGSDSNGDAENSWKTEGFGSSSRSRGSSRRGSGRRRASRRTTTASPSGDGTDSSTSYSSSPPSSSSPSKTEVPSSSSSASTTGSQRQPQPQGTTSSSSLNKYGEVPPHRRTQSSYVSRQEEDKQRMREIKVDEEFDKLKKQLGL